MLNPRINRVWIGKNDFIGYLKEMIYERIPNCFTHCFIQDHEVSYCNKLKPKVASVNENCLPKQAPKAFLRHVPAKSSGPTCANKGL